MSTRSQVYSGGAFDYADPRPEMILIEDLAQALSHQPRFAGHTQCFYSVAEHSVRVSQFLEARHPNNPQLALWGLLHDASEAYLADIPRPARMLTGFSRAYDIAELRIMQAIAVRFGLPLRAPPRLSLLQRLQQAVRGVLGLWWDRIGNYLPREVRHADDVLLATERVHLLLPTTTDVWDAWPLPDPLEVEDHTMGWHPVDARQAFLDTYQRLVSGDVR